MGRPQRPGEPRPRRSVLVALLLACATLITLDFHGGTGSPVEPARRAMGEVFGPVESAQPTPCSVRTVAAVWSRLVATAVVLTMMTESGTISVARISSIARVRPLNSYLLSAKAAMELTMSVISVAITVTNTEFHR